MVVESIGTEGGEDFATIALWAGDGGRLDGDIGELKNELFDEHVTIAVDNLTLRVIAGQEGTRTFGSGPRIIPSTAGDTFTISNGTFVIEDVEVHTGPTSTNAAIAHSANVTARRCLFRLHASGGAGSDGFKAVADSTIVTENCVFYDFSGRSYDAEGSTVTLTEKHGTHYGLTTGVSVAQMSNGGSWTFEGSLFGASGTADNFVGTSGTTLNVIDCIFDNAESTANFDVNTNNTFSATFQWGSGGSGTRVMFNPLEPDFHLFDQVGNVAQNYIPAARAPYVTTDLDNDTRPSGASDANDAGADEYVTAEASSSGVWSSEVSFAAGDDYRVTIDGPAANQTKISVTLEFEE